MSKGRFALLILATLHWSCDALSQELTPRAYWPAPNGTNVLSAGYQYTTGDVIIDQSLPVTGVNSDIHSAMLSYQRTLSLFDRTSSLLINVPYTTGDTEGDVNGMQASRHITGFGDIRARLAVNLVGAPTMDGQGFQALRAAPRTIVGASVVVQVPTGRYETGKLINVGTNRWSVKPAIGVIWPLHPTWLLEFEVGAWFFGEDEDFVLGSRKQDPILSTEIHLVKRFRPGLWAALDANYYVGGRTEVDGQLNADLQRNSRAGATLVFPFKKRHAIKASISRGLVTESGGDYTIFGLAYFFVWR